MTSSDNMISKDLRNNPNLYTIKRLFPKDAAKELAHILFESDTSEKDPDFFYKGGLKAGKPKITGKNSHEIILQYWDYDIALQFTRSEIVKTDQYGLYCYEKYAHWKYAECNYRKTVEIRETVIQNNKNQWRMAPMHAYSEFVRIARMRGISDKARAEMIAELGNNIVSNINYQTARNDLIEYILFETKQEVFPTLVEIKGVDFFYNGVPYDQKVTFGLGAFERKFDSQEEAFDAAKKNPKLVLETLFKDQDFSRFNSSNTMNRLLFSLTDLRVTHEEIKLAIKKIDLSSPFELDVFFSNKQMNQKVQCEMKSFFCQI